MTEFRVAVEKDQDLDEACDRAVEAGYEILARFHCFGVFLAGGHGTAALRALGGVRAVEVIREEHDAHDVGVLEEGAATA